jgi:hypothetical protein
MKRSVLIIAAALVVAACGSSSGTATPSTSTSPSTAPVPSVSAIASCDEVKVAAAHLTTFLHYVALNVGSDNDSSAYFTEMRDTVASLQAAKGVCAGDATVQLAALAAGVETLAAAYQPGTDAATIAKDKAAVLALVPLGKAAFTALGMDPASWDDTARFPV